MMNKAEDFPKAKDIRVLSINTKGKDLLVGDIHGNIESLKLLISQLGDQDRLIIAGDLTDRGPGSFEVVKTIVEFNQVRRRAGLPEIEVSRGNHENIFLDYFYGRNNNIFNKSIGGHWVKTITPEQLKFVAEYFSSLPYILHAPGDDPFNVVHADMPISDEEMLKRIGSNNFTLTEIEKTHATWAREGTDVLGKGRDVTSIVTYCGHSIRAGVRSDSNHINLDIGTYAINNVCLVEHQTKLCKLLGKPETQALALGLEESALDIKNEINFHFALVATIKKIINIGKDSLLKDKPQKIELAIGEFITKFMSQGYNMDGVYKVVLDNVLPKLTAEMQESFKKYTAVRQLKPLEVKVKIDVTIDSLVTKIKDLDNNKVLVAPQDKAKQIDVLLLTRALEYTNTGRNRREAYIMALRDVSHLFSKETKKALGDYLQAIKKHQLLEADTFRMFAESPESQRRYINKALTILGISHIAPKIIVKPLQGHFMELKRVILDSVVALSPRTLLTQLDLKSKIAQIEAKITDPLLRYKELVSNWNNGWSNSFRGAVGNDGINAIADIEHAIEMLDNDLASASKSPSINGVG